MRHKCTSGGGRTASTASGRQSRRLVSGTSRCHPPCYTISRHGGCPVRTAHWGWSFELRPAQSRATRTSCIGCFGPSTSQQASRCPGPMASPRRSTVSTPHAMRRLPSGSNKVSIPSGSRRRWGTPQSSRRWIDTATCLKRARMTRPCWQDSNPSC